MGNFFHKNNIIKSPRLEFPKGTFTANILLSVFSNILNNLDKVNIYIGIYLTTDFDAIYYTHLLNKLEILGT